MIQRIVRMEFRTEEIEAFKALFEENKEKIRGFEGCNSLKLLQDVNKPAIFFTYSVWNSEDDLNNYRHSELFAKVWKATKSKFAGRAEAWSTDLLHAL
jgi:quinol monooxygenase YgiN